MYDFNASVPPNVVDRVTELADKNGCDSMDIYRAVLKWACSARRKDAQIRLRKGYVEYSSFDPQPLSRWGAKIKVRGLPDRLKDVIKRCCNETGLMRSTALTFWVLSFSSAELAELVE
jgi:hypothetical protein